MNARDARIGRGFTDATDTTLAAIRSNLLDGLTLVDEHRAAGTLHTVAPKRASSPAEAGRITLGLLVRLDEELAHRTDQAGT